jgi:hypothetical protein
LTVEPTGNVAFVREAKLTSGRRSREVARGIDGVRLTEVENAADARPDQSRSAAITAAAPMPPPNAPLREVIE